MALAVEGKHWQTAQLLLSHGADGQVSTPSGKSALRSALSSNRPELVRALRLLTVAGVTTNRDFLLAVLTHPAFEAGEIDTHFIDRHLPRAARRAPRDPEADRLHAIAAAIHACEGRRGRGPLPPGVPSGWRNNRWGPQRVSYRIAGEPFEVGYVERAPGLVPTRAGTAGGEARLCHGPSKTP